MKLATVLKVFLLLFAAGWLAFVYWKSPPDGLLNTVGMLAILGAVIFTAYRFYYLILSKLVRGRRHK